MRTLTRKNLDDLAKVMPIISELEQQKFVGGNEFLPHYTSEQALGMISDGTWLGGHVEGWGQTDSEIIPRGATMSYRASPQTRSYSASGSMSGQCLHGSSGDCISHGSDCTGSVTGIFFYCTGACSGDINCSGYCTGAVTGAVCTGACSGQADCNGDCTGAVTDGCNTTWGCDNPPVDGSGNCAEHSTAIDEDLCFTDDNGICKEHGEACGSDGSDDDPPIPQPELPEVEVPGRPPDSNDHGGGGGGQDRWPGSDDVTGSVGTCSGVIGCDNQVEEGETVCEDHDDPCAMAGCLQPAIDGENTCKSHACDAQDVDNCDIAQDSRDCLTHGEAPLITFIETNVEAGGHMTYLEYVKNQASAYWEQLAGTLAGLIPGVNHSMISLDAAHDRMRIDFVKAGTKGHENIYFDMYITDETKVHLRVRCAITGDVIASAGFEALTGYHLY